MSEQCTLLPGAYGVFVQGLLFVVSVGALVAKKKREDMLLRLEARTWSTFVLDSSKQLAGAAWVHVVNLVCAWFLGMHFEASGCDWYWVNIMLDTTLGVAIECILLWVLTEAFEWATFNMGTFRSGEYKDEAGRFVPAKYLAQLAVWLFCVTFMKLLMFFVMLSLHMPLQLLAELFLAPFLGFPQGKLLVVTVVTPCIMNAVQLWLTDSFIKRRQGKIIDTADLSDLDDLQ